MSHVDLEFDCEGCSVIPRNPGYLTASIRSADLTEVLDCIDDEQLFEYLQSEDFNFEEALGGEFVPC